MPDETTATATTAPAEAPPADQPAPAATAQPDGGSPTTETTSPERAPAADWRTVIDTVDVSELRSHPRFQGVVGDAVDKAMRRWRADQEAEVSTRAAERARTEMLDLARKDPEAFAERYLSDVQREDTMRRLEGLRADTRAEFARMVGAAYREIPEWAEFTPEHHERLAKAVAGKPDDEVVAAFNRAALEVVAEIRAEKRASERVEKFKASELAKEREAIRKEVAAELLKAEQKPDMSRGGRPAAFDPTTLSDAEFDRWYETEGPGKDLGLARR